MASAINTDTNKINDLLTKGVVEVIKKEDLEKKLKSGKQLRIKLGIDPSGTDLHIGHMVVIKKLKEFQDLGHQIILLFGNFTGQIGDPTGKAEARAIKTKEQLEANAKKYIDQASFFLDTSKVEIRWNADWLEPLNFGDIIKLSACFTQAQMMERDMFQDRVKNNQPISMHEFMYPLMQGYDSVALKADVELGGTDQTFNLLAGRTIQKAYEQVPQDILTVPLLEGTDGVKKMGKSENNFIAVDDEPNEMFGKVMSIPDEMIVKYFELATNATGEEIESVKKAIESGENPMTYKKQLARDIIEIYHDKVAGESAEENFTKVFSEHRLPDDMPEKKAEKKEMNIIDLLVWAELVESKSEARRLVEQGAVKIDDNKVEGVDSVIDLSGEHVMQVGKRRFIKIVE